MQIAELLAEQRRIGDEFRAVEKIIRKIHSLLAEAEINSGARAQLEKDLMAGTTEWLGIGRRMLELDAEVARSLATERLHGSGAPGTPRAQIVRA